MTRPFSSDYVEHLGFAGFDTVSSIQVNRCREIPSKPGAYVVLRARGDPPRFLTRSVGGWFKGNDPTVEVARLKERWLTNTPVLYIGMAGTSLRDRVRALVDYGVGRPVGHQGGRYLWQVQGSADFLVGWKIDMDGRALESSLFVEFEAAHGQLPFANLSH
jgi:hypothetical protein